MKQRKLDELEKCIELMETGVPIEEYIKKFPDLSPEIRKILVTAKDVDNLSEEQIPVEGMNRSRTELLSRIKQFATNEKQGGWLVTLRHTIVNIRLAFYGIFSPRPFLSRLILAMLITGVLILFSRGLVITSAKSLPGDTLYPIKRAVEDISVYLVPDHEVRQEHEDNYSLHRVDEVKSLLTISRIQQISFEGVLESMSDSNWIVSGVSISIQPGTTFVGGGAQGLSFEIGSVVEVEGVTNSQGSVTANEIHLRKYQFIGLVQEIRTDQWQISGIQLSITPHTQIDNGIRVGDYVTILVRSDDTGLIALAILLEEHPGATPFEPNYTPMPSESEDADAGTIGEHQIVGTLDEIGDRFWVVSGQIVYLGSNIERSNEFTLGDHIIVKYIIEANGSWTVLEVDRYSLDSQPGDSAEQNTPETDSGYENEGPSTSEPTPNEEKQEPTDSPEIHETPVPTEGSEESP